MIYNFRPIELPVTSEPRVMEFIYANRCYGDCYKKEITQLKIAL
jgi:hypothetical protein